MHRLEQPSRKSPAHKAPRANLTGVPYVLTKDEARRIAVNVALWPIGVFPPPSCAWEARGTIARGACGMAGSAGRSLSDSPAGLAGLRCLPSMLTKMSRRRSYGWAASRDKVERTKATILAFRSGPREADHTRQRTRRRCAVSDRAWVHEVRPIWCKRGDRSERKSPARGGAVSPRSSRKGPWGDLLLHSPSF